MDKIQIESTSRDSARASDITVRDGERVRLIFRPEIVNNAQDPAACLKGKFVYQKRKKGDSWEDVPRKPISQLGGDEEYQLELHSAELLGLLRELGALYRFARVQGVPKGQVELVRLERRLSELLALSDVDFRRLLDAHPKDGVAAAAKILDWLAGHDDLTSVLSAAPAGLPRFSALIGVAALKSALSLWEAHSGNDDEDFWQESLEEHSILLSAILGYPIVVLQSKAYVGGKRFDNKGGGLVDFLAETKSTGNVVLVEIKTPTTALLGGEYRAGVYPPSTELAGGISQVLSYRHRLLSNPDVLRSLGDVGVATVEPRGVVIVGHTDQLIDEDRTKAFELFRQRVAGVTVITFDELFQRAADLVALIEQAS